MMLSKTIFLILIISILFISGCIGNDVDVTELVKQTQQGHDFLSKYPRAEITAVSLSNETIASMIDEIRINCHPAIPVKAYWNVKFTDPDTNTKLNMWIDKETQEVICIIKKANTNKTEPNNQTQHIPENNDNSIPEIRKNCMELNGFLCDESNDCAVGWLDSSDSYCCPIECNTCPSNCDDENPCTKDECNKETEYECTHQEIEQCLSNGNGICETGELVPDILTSPDCNICGTWNNNVDCTPFLTSSTTAETISDCPLNCADSDEKTLDWYDFETQECKHVICEDEKTCPDSCDDNNICTTDYCSESTNYVCSYDAITPCCGNSICENGEDYSSCTQDCTSLTDVDLSPPILNEIWIEPTNINDGETIIIYANVSDDLSGVDFVFPTLKSPSETSSFTLQFGGLTFNPSSGLWVKEVTIPQYSDAGLWTIPYVELGDKANNRDWLNYGTDYYSNFTLQSTIQDITPPVLHSIWIVPNKINDGDSITIYANVTDDISGVNFVFPTLKRPSEESSFTLQFGGLDYSPVTGLWNKQVNIPKYSESGIWIIPYVELGDNVENRDWLNYGKEIYANFTVE